MTRGFRRRLRALALVGGMALAGAVAADPIQDAWAHLGPNDVSPMIHSLVVLTLLSFIPLMAIALTSFTRIIVVLSLVRSALGLQQTPPNAVLLTLAMFLTLFSMNPVFEAAKTVGIDPYLKNEIPADIAMTRAFEPFKMFMIKQTREDDLAAVLKMAHLPMPSSAKDIGALQLVPAFMLSELRTAFQIGFVIFLPFLLIDLVVSALLMALGMIMLPPTTISLPLKILLFVLINGWTLLAQALISGFRT